MQVYSRASVLGFSKEELDDILQAIQPEDLQVFFSPATWLLKRLLGVSRFSLPSPGFFLPWLFLALID